MWKLTESLGGGGEVLLQIKLEESDVLTVAGRSLHSRRWLRGGLGGRMTRSKNGGKKERYEEYGDKRNSHKQPEDEMEYHLKQEKQEH